MSGERGEEFGVIGDLLEGEVEREVEREEGGLIRFLRGRVLV
jgi:hypothetical protein